MLLTGKKQKMKVRLHMTRLMTDLLIPMKGVEEDFDESNSNLDRILNDLETFRKSYQQKFKYLTSNPTNLPGATKSSTKISGRRSSRSNVQSVSPFPPAGVSSPLLKPSNATGRLKSKRKSANSWNQGKHIKKSSRRCRGGYTLALTPITIGGYGS